MKFQINWWWVVKVCVEQNHCLRVFFVKNIHSCCRAGSAPVPLSVPAEHSARLYKSCCLHHWTTHVWAQCFFNITPSSSFHSLYLKDARHVIPPPSSVLFPMNVSLPHVFFFRNHFPLCRAQTKFNCRLMTDWLWSLSIHSRKVWS